MDHNHMIKGKRTKRPRTTSYLSLTMATSSCSTASGDDDGFNRMDEVEKNGIGNEEVDMANCLILLSGGLTQKSSKLLSTASNKALEDAYKCKTCNRSFPSFQALGGHRTSHKKLKPITLDEKKHSRNVPLHDDPTILALQVSSKDHTGSNESKSKVHFCSICGSEFATGQALGGHMRRHRPVQVASSSSIEESQETKKSRNLLSLDLNLPAPEDEQRESKFEFGSKEESVIVFSASPLVDCHY